MSNDLITVPTFTYHQGKHYDNSFDENPINVDFYNGTICLRQEDAYEEEECINISPKHLDALFKAIKKNLPEALIILERNTK